VPAGVPRDFEPLSGPHATMSDEGSSRDDGSSSLMTPARGAQRTWTRTTPTPIGDRLRARARRRQGRRDARRSSRCSEAKGVYESFLALVPRAESEQLADDARKRLSDVTWAPCKGRVSSEVDSFLVSALRSPLQIRRGQGCAIVPPTTVQRVAVRPSVAARNGH
jgi:hypothetical protein